MKTNKRNIFLALLFAVIMCVCAAVMFIGCSKVNVTTKEPDDPTIEEPEPPHEHEFTKWASDADWHWKTCEADGVAGPKSKHNYANGVCECGRTDSRKFGSVKGKIVIKGGAETPDYSDVKIDFGGDDVVVGAIASDGTFTVTHVTVGKEYTVTASKTGYVPCSYVVRVNADGDTVDLSTKPFELIKSIFDSWMGWDLDQHDFSKINDAEPKLGVYGKSLNVITHAKYDDVASSLWMRAENSSHIQSIQGIFVKFEDGKYMFLRVEQLTENSVGTGEYKLQWAKNFDGTGDWGGNKLSSVIDGWKDFVNPLDAPQKAAFEGTDGLKVTLMRKGCALYAFVDGKWIEGGTMTLPVEYADDKVQVGYWGYDGTDNAQWQFELEDNVGTYAEKIPTHTAIMAEQPTNGDASFDKASYKYGDMAVITVVPDTGYILGTLTVNGKDVATSVKDGKYAFKVVEDITASATFISEGQTFNTTFTVPAAANANGMKITLYRDGGEKKEGTVSNNAFTINDIKPGTWHAKTTVYGVEVNLNDVNVNGAAVTLDMSGVFGTPTLIDFGNEKSFVYTEVTEDVRYTIPANIRGDAYFALKLKSPTALTNMGDDHARFGLRMFYGEDNKELSITLVVKNKKWAIQTCGSSVYDEQRDIPQSYLSAIAADGVYMAVYREVNNGKVHVYMGIDKNNLTEVKVFDSAKVTEITKNSNIVRFGASFWKNGTTEEYAATISDVMYGTSMVKALGVQDRAVTVTGKGDVMDGDVKVGTITVPETVNVYDNILVTITPATGYKLATFRVNDSNISLGALNSVGDGSYTGTLVCYLATELTLNATFEECTLVDFTLNASGKKNGVTTAFNNVSFTLTDVNDPHNTKSGKFTNGTIELKNLVTPATYKLAVEGYYEKEFTLANGAATATFVLDYKWFDLWHGWDGAQHDFSKTNDAEPVIGNNGATLNVISHETYKNNVSVSLWMKNGNSTYTAGGSNSGVQGIFVKYADGKYMFLRMLRDETKGNKPHRFQWAPEFDGGNGTWNGKDVHSVISDKTKWYECGNGQYETELNSTDGVKVTVVRQGKMLYVLIDDALMPNMTQTLPDDYGDDQVQVGFWAYNSKANATWKYEIRQFEDTLNNVEFFIKSDESVNGKQVTLSRSGETDVVGTFNAQGKFTANVKTGLWTAKMNLFGVENTFSVVVSDTSVRLQPFTVNSAILKDSYAYTKNSETFNSRITTNISGDAYFAFKIVCGTDISSWTTSDNVRIGLVLSYAEGSGRTLRLVNKNNKFRLQELNGWEDKAVISDSYLNTNLASGVYFVIKREAATGYLYVYAGTSKDNLALGATFNDNQNNRVNIRKSNIVELGVMAEKDNYDATISEVSYGTSIAAALGMTDQSAVTVTGSGDVTGGKVEVSADPKQYSDVTITFTVNDGYKLNSLKVNGTAVAISALTVVEENKKYTYVLRDYTGKTLSIEATFVQYTEVKNFALTVKGHKAGDNVNLSGKITLTAADNTTHEYDLTNGSVLLADFITPATYKISIADENYNDGEFTVTNGANSATVSLEYKRFNYWFGWADTLHDFSAVNNDEPELKFKNTDKNDQCLNVISRDTYTDVSASLWMKKGISLDSGEIQGIFLKFDDEKYMSLRLEKYDKTNGWYKLQWTKELKEGPEGQNNKPGYTMAPGADWKDFQMPLSDSQYALFEQGDGLKVTVVRRGVKLYALVNDVLIDGGTMTLTDNAYASKKVQVGYWTRGCKGNSTRKFDIRSVADIGNTTFDTVSFKVDSAYKAGITSVSLAQDGESGGSITCTIDNGAITATNVQGGLWTATVNMTVFGIQTTYTTPVWIDSTAPGLNPYVPFESSSYTSRDITQKNKYTAGTYYAVSTNITGDAWFVTKLKFDKNDYKTTKSDNSAGELRMGFRLYHDTNKTWANEMDATLLFNGTNWYGATCGGINDPAWTRSNAITGEPINALYGDGMYFAVFRNALTGELAYYVGSEKNNLTKLEFGTAQIYESCKKAIRYAGFGFWIDAGQYYSASASGTMYYSTEQAFKAAGYAIATTTPSA